MTNYGQGAVPGLTTTVSDKPGVKTEIQSSVPGIQLWGHSIVLDGERGIKCHLCEQEEEIPELLEMSNGFREVVYKMYVLGKFRASSCSPDREDIEDIIEDLDRNTDKFTTPNTRHRVDPNRTHFVDTTTTRGRTSAQSDTVDMYVPKGQRMMISGTPYTYHGDGTWINEDKNVPLGTVDLIDKHGKEAKAHLPPEVVKEKEAMLKRRQDMMQQQTLDKVGIGDIQDAGVDTGSIQTDTVTDSSIDADATDLNAAEKLARGLQDKTGHFLTR